MPGNSPDVDKLLDALLDREGGFTNNSADRGGPTNFGITEHVARAYGYTGNMQDLPRDFAKSIYIKQYWNNPGFAQVGTYYPAVAAELFDTGVNMGPQTASKFLQRALNVLNRGSVDYPDINVDGDIGKMTLYSLEQYKAKRGALGETVLVKLLTVFQGMRYVEIAETNRSQEAFMFGWIANRI